MLKRLPVFACLLLASCALPQQKKNAAAPAPVFGGLAAVPVSPEPPADWAERNEMRAGWIVSWRQMISTRTIHQALDWAQVARLNTLFVQVRASGDAYYRSKIVPRAETLQEQPEDFDPLAYILEQAKARGIAIHAWMNAGIVWRSTAAPAASGHIFNAHPEWVMRDANGKLAYPDSYDPKPSVVENYYWLNWGHPDARRHLVDVVSEVVSKYPVDGIHLDFVRFPARMGSKTPGAGYDPTSVQAFKTATGAEPLEHTEAWDQWRTDQVGKTIEAIHDAIREKRPTAALSVAALASWSLAYARAFTDYRDWLRRDILDFAVLMSYFKNPAQIEKSALNAVETTAPGRAVLGLHIGRHEPDAMAAQLRLSRRYNLKGFSLFALDEEVRKELGGYLARLRAIAIPSADDARYAKRNPAWHRLGVIDARTRQFEHRFFSRNGRTKAVIYQNGLDSMTLSIGEETLPVIQFEGKSPVQVDLSAYTLPYIRDSAANHDFRLRVQAQGGPDGYAQVFIVDLYASSK